MRQFAKSNVVLILNVVFFSRLTHSCLASPKRGRMEIVKFPNLFRHECVKQHNIFDGHSSRKTYMPFNEALIMERTRHLKKKRKEVIQKDCYGHTAPLQSPTTSPFTGAVVHCCTFEVFTSGSRNPTTVLELCAPGH